MQLALQSDGKILAFCNEWNSRAIRLYRYNADGSIDTSFDGDGKYTAPSLPSVFEQIWGVELQPDGKLVVVGAWSPTDAISVYERATGRLVFGPARKGDVYRIAIDNSRAQRDLDWRPQITLEEGLRLTVDYFRHQVAAPHA